MVDEPTKTIVKDNRQEHTALPSVEHLLFKAPLYATFSLNDDLNEVKILYNRAHDAQGRYVRTMIDGYCPQCKRDSPFRIDGIVIPSGEPWTNIRLRHSFDQMTVTCSRSEHHKIR
jgi:hypothetical protein